MLDEIDINKYVEKKVKEARAESCLHPHAKVVGNLQALLGYALGTDIQREVAKDMILEVLNEG